MGEWTINPHTPSHLFVPETVYMVTAGTYQAKNLFDSEIKLQMLKKYLLGQAFKHSWTLIAWAVLPNHYHFIGISPENPSTLVALIRGVHSLSAKYVNAIDETHGRRVWHNYWDTCIRTEKDLIARLKYVHLNPVKHGQVTDPLEYPYCSYAWFVQSASPSFMRDVERQELDNIKVYDPY
jgi:putative transposase